jgi:hypothetical protein
MISDYRLFAQQNVFSFTLGTFHEAGSMPAGAANVNLSYSTPETCGTGETQEGGARLPSMNTYGLSFPPIFLNSKNDVDHWVPHPIIIEAKFSII